MFFMASFTNGCLSFFSTTSGKEQVTADYLQARMIAASSYRLSCLMEDSCEPFSWQKWRHEPQECGRSRGHDPSWAIEASRRRWVKWTINKLVKGVTFFTKKIPTSAKELGACTNAAIFGWGKNKREKSVFRDFWAVYRFSLSCRRTNSPGKPEILASNPFVHLGHTRGGMLQTNPADLHFGFKFGLLYAFTN